MQLSQSASAPSGGAHTQFKEALRADLHRRIERTVKSRAGPSFEERMEKAVKGFRAKTRAIEAEQCKNLSASIERGRSRPTSAPVRPRAETPNQNLMLQERQKKMQECEVQYREQLEALRDRMDKREPLFRVSEVNAAFAMQKQRQEERRQQLAEEEHERWERLRSVEEKVLNRPLLIEGPHRRVPKRDAPARTEPSPQDADENVSKRPLSAMGRDEYDCDRRIRAAMSQRWYEESDWAKTVQRIKEKTNSRRKLHEIEYPNRPDAHGLLSRSRLMHTLAARMPAAP